MSDLIDPASGLFIRAPRVHDDKGRIDPAVLAAAQALDEALGFLLAQARAVVALNPNRGQAVQPLTLVRGIEKLKARLNLFDGAVAQFQRERR